MTSIAPSPNSNSAPPNSTTTSSPPSSNDTPTSPAPTTAQPNATSDPPTPSPPSNSSNSSSSSPPPPPPPQAPPPAVSTAPPPESLSPPPPTPVVPTSEPPPSSPSPPPPSSVSSPPPTTTTPAADPPSSSPPPPPSPVVSPPPPKRSPPPDSPSPPTVTSPPPQEASPPPPSPDASPPPPSADSSPPLSSSSPPPPSANPPKSSPAPPTGTPPPTVTPAPPTATPPKASRPAAPPPKDSPATPSPPINQTQPSPSAPPPSVPSALPPSNSSTNQSSLTPTQPMPTQPIEGPDSASTNPSENTNRTKSSGINTGGAVAIGVVVTIVVLSLIGVAFWFSRKKKRKFTGYHAGHVMPSPLGSSPVSDSSQTKAYSSAPLIGSGSASDFMYSSSESGVLSNSRSIFTYEELMEATSRFSAQNLLGEGGFGCVYKGILPDGREVAVKQLKLGGSQGEREFSAEVETISRVHHRHLVSLVGYCISDHQRLLVYDFVPNNTLHFHLHEEGRPVMDWATRVKVAIGAARGISYLHEDCHPRIIHRDIKSSNILLDNNFDAQVSDFGLAKLALDAYTHITTRVMGTFGYMAPEYASSGKLTEKSDVYSFGVVLLELITGRKPVDTSQPMGDESLVEWARPLMTDALDNREFGGLIDPRLEGYYVESEVFQMIEAAAACVRHSGAKRPRMGQVVRALEGIGDSTDLTNGIRPGQSEIFNTAQQSAEIRMFQRMAFGSQDYNSDMFSRSSWAS